MRQSFFSKFQYQNGKKRKSGTTLSGLQNGAVSSWQIWAGFTDYTLEQKDYKSGQRYFESAQEGFQIGAEQCIVISVVIRFHRTDGLICYVLQTFSKIFLIIVQNFTIHSNIVQIKSDGLFYTFCFFKSWSPDQSKCTKNCHS